MIPSQNGGPFAQKTLLGWGIVGTIDMSVKDEDVFGCSHGVVADSVNLDNKSPVHVALKSTVKAVMSPKQVPAALEQNVADIKNQGKNESSRDGKKFLENNITNTEDKHYEI